MQRLSQIPIGLQPREEVVKTCPFQLLDYQLISEKDELLKQQSYFNKDVFGAVHTTLGLGRGFQHMGKYGKEEFRPDYYK